MTDYDPNGRASLQEWLERALAGGDEGATLPILAKLPEARWALYRPIVEAWFVEMIKTKQERRAVRFMMHMPDARRKPFRDLWATLRPAKPKATEESS